jgi:hypothetical protein
VARQACACVRNLDFVPWRFEPGDVGVEVTTFTGLYLLRATRSRVVVTYGGLGRSPGCDGFRVDFGSVKEIVSGARLSSRPG